MSESGRVPSAARAGSPRATSPASSTAPSLHSEGISREALAGRPVIGICNSWSELVNCNLHFRGLAESVKRGVLMAGGLPLEFPTISLGENLMKPTAMLYPQPHVDGRRGVDPRRIRSMPSCCSAAATRRCPRS